MKTKIIIGLFALVMGVAGIIFSLKGGEVNESKISTFAGAPVTLHKSLTCGCCEVYGSYMRKIGYEVLENNTTNLNNIKRDLGVPEELWSCHTSEIGNYVIEGHIPNEAIEKLLTEKPDIRGIGMAGMPSGSPGMPGEKEPFMIYEINYDGTMGQLFMEL